MHFSLYQWLDRIFPRSYSFKIMAVAFVGTHIPLLTAAIFTMLAYGGLAANLGPLLILLGATLIGTGLTLLAIHQLLRPVIATEKAMARFEHDSTIDPLPRQYRDEVGRIMRRASRLMRASRLRIATAKLEAQTDPLTALLNRRGFQEAMPDMDAGVLFMLDIDHFKQVNDEEGHDAGDTVLRHIAAIVRETVRADDIVARTGGEEFVVFLPRTPIEIALEVAGRVRAAVERSDTDGIRAVTISIGVAERAGEEELVSLLKRADTAVYAAKAAGRNLVVDARTMTPIANAPKPRR